MKCFPSKPLRAANDMPRFATPGWSSWLQEKGRVGLWRCNILIKGNSHLVAQREVKTLVASKYLLFELSCIIQTYYKAKDVWGDHVTSRLGAARWSRTSIQLYWKPGLRSSVLTDLVVHTVSLWHNGAFLFLYGHKRHSTHFSPVGHGIYKCFLSIIVGTKLIFLLGSSWSCICRLWYVFKEPVQFSLLVKCIKLINTCEVVSSNPNAFTEFVADCFSIRYII